MRARSDPVTLLKGVSNEKVKGVCEKGFPLFKSPSPTLTQDIYLILNIY